MGECLRGRSREGKAEPVRRPGDVLYNALLAQGSGKLVPLSQIGPAALFCTPGELKMVSKF